MVYRSNTVLPDCGGSPVSVRGLRDPTRVCVCVCVCVCGGGGGATCRALRQTSAVQLKVCLVAEGGPLGDLPPGELETQVVSDLVQVVQDLSNTRPHQHSPPVKPRFDSLLLVQYCVCVCVCLRITRCERYRVQI